MFWFDPLIMCIYLYIRSKMLHQQSIWKICSKKNPQTLTVCIKVSSYQML